MTDDSNSGPKDLGDWLTTLFVNDDRELRSGWRLAIFILAVVTAAIVIEGGARSTAMLIPSLRVLAGERLPETPTTDSVILFAALISQVKLLVAVLAASAACARWLERRTLASVGYKLHPGWFRDFALGSAIGSATISLAVAVEFGAGAVHFNRELSGAGATYALGYLFVLFLLAGAIEELLFRGFGFQALIDGGGGFLAVGLTSGVFGLAHIWNDHASVFSTLNTVLAGVWLGAAYLMTRSLWLATALHYSWNLIMAFVFGLPVSGIESFQKLAVLRGESTNPLWVSGGNYGPEAGAAATLALLVSTLLIWRGGWFRPAAEMIEALRHGKPQRPLSISINDDVLETKQDVRTS